MQIVNRVRLYARRHGAGASWLYFLLIIASEARRFALGSEHSRAILKALVWPRSRPPELGLSRGLLPR